MRDLTLKAGRRSRILWIFSGSIPTTVRFRAAALDDAPVSGVVELFRRQWLDPETTHHPLGGRNVFSKGFSDADFRIYVTPDCDCRITFETRHFRAETFFRILAGVLVLGALAAGTALFLAEPPTPAQLQGQ